MASDWTDEEVAAIVGDYLSMLRHELQGTAYNKTEHRKRLLENLDNRSGASVEHKHMNISAVLLLHGYPCIRGYKPLVNFQRKLEPSVLEAIKQDPFLREQKGRGLSIAELRISEIAARKPQDIIAPPPLAESNIAAQGKAYLINWAEREDRNRRIGALGEQLVVAVERQRLDEVGRSDLSRKVSWVAHDLGDGLGYDVLSYTDKGREMYIEVKTTVLGSRAPFYISRNELDFARVTEEAYRLYRVHDLNSDPRIYTLENPLEKHCKMIASGFLAVPTFS